MNKRHYEHTLPNIRGSLSNTYCFPDFIGSRPLDCLFAQGLGKENTGAERG